MTAERKVLLTVVAIAAENSAKALERECEEDFQLFLSFSAFLRHSHLKIRSTAEVLSILVENFFDDVEIVDDDAPGGAEGEAVHVTVDLTDGAESFERYFVLTEEGEIAKDRPWKGPRRLRQHISLGCSDPHAALVLVDQPDVDDEQEDQDDVEQVEAEKSHFQFVTIQRTKNPFSDEAQNTSTLDFVVAPTFPTPT